MTKADVIAAIERVADLHPYARLSDRQASDTVLKQALVALETYASEFVCGACGGAAVHKEEQ